MTPAMMQEYRISTANRLKKVRQVRGYTQEALSEMLNISDRQYRRYEAGDTPLPLLTCFQICEILRIEVNYLLCGIHVLDMIIEQAVRTMPEDMFQNHISQILALQDMSCERPSLDLEPILMELFNQGVDHRFDPPVREFEQKLTIFTEFYENNNYDPIFSNQDLS